MGFRNLFTNAGTVRNRGRGRRAKLFELDRYNWVLVSKLASFQCLVIKQDSIQLLPGTDRMESGKESTFVML